VRLLDHQITPLAGYSGESRVGRSEDELAQGVLPELFVAAQDEVLIVAPSSGSLVVEVAEEVSHHGLVPPVWSSRSAIIAPSQVLPVRAEPKIHTRFSGFMPTTSASRGLA